MNYKYLVVVFILLLILLFGGYYAFRSTTVITLDELEQYRGKFRFLCGFGAYLDRNNKKIVSIISDIELLDKDLNKLDPVKDKQLAMADMMDDYKTLLDILPDNLVYAKTIDVSEETKIVDKLLNYTKPLTYMDIILTKGTNNYVGQIPNSGNIVAFRVGSQFQLGSKCVINGKTYTNGLSSVNIPIKTGDLVSYYKSPEEINEEFTMVLVFN